MKLQINYQQYDKNGGVLQHVPQVSDCKINLSLSTNTLCSLCTDGSTFTGDGLETGLDAGNRATGPTSFTLKEE